MRLSQLLHYLEHIQSQLPEGGDELLAREYDPMIHYVSNHPLAQPHQVAALQAARHKIQQGMVEFDAALDEIRSWIQAQGSPLQTQLLAQSYSVYEEQTRSPQSHLYDPRAILENRAPLSDAAREFVRSRISARVTWQDPALIIRPGLEDWITDMVAFDPLYVFDHYQALLEPAQDRFNALYRGRVRWCVGDDHDTQQILHGVPDGQIGFCFAWHFFYWKPFETIRRYLQEIAVKLRPGGVVAFTFNDGDRYGGADNAERHCGCFVPGSMLRAYAESLGFATVMTHELDRAVTWMEFQKPGSRVSIKGAQTLAEIRWPEPPPPPELVGPPPPPPPPPDPEEELRRLHSIRPIRTLRG